MKLIPKNHEQAIRWVSQAWHRVFLSPSETAEMLANICGCSDWQELSVHITNQRGGDYEPNGYMIISEDSKNKIDFEVLSEIRARQANIMTSAFNCQDDLKEAIAHSMLDTLFVLDIAKLSNSKQDPIQETLRSIYLDKADIREIKNQEANPSSEECGIELVLPIFPERFAEFSKSLGWHVVESSINHEHMPFHKSFDFKTMNGTSVPAYILRLDDKYRFGGEHFEDAVNIVKKLSGLNGATRAVLFLNLFLTAKDDLGHEVTLLGYLIRGAEEEAMPMHVCKNMKSLDSLFDLNEKYYNLLHSGESGVGPGIEFPKFIIDPGLHIAKLFNRYVPQE